MKHFVLIPNPTKDRGFRVSKSVCETLNRLGATVYVARNLLPYFDRVFPYDGFPPDAEAIIVVGGDGSILDASVTAIKYGLPLLGVNLGKLGYLSEVEPTKIDKLSALITGDCKIREGMLLEVSLESEGEEYRADRLAINDITLSHQNGIGMSFFTLENRDGGSVNYRADGLIVSTPAGSTAYSLSAGGPIVANNVSSMLVTPLAPHSFFDRSIIFDQNDELTIKNIGDDEMFISIDGRVWKNLSPYSTAKVKVSNKRIKMITLEDNTMFKTLFSKMKLLEDIQ